MKRTNVLNHSRILVEVDFGANGYYVMLGGGMANAVFTCEKTVSILLYGWISNQTRQRAEFKHIIKRRKRN